MLFLVDVLIMQYEPKFEGVIRIGTMIAKVIGFLNGSIKVCILTLDKWITIKIKNALYFIIRSSTRILLDSIDQCCFGMAMMNRLYNSSQDRKGFEVLFFSLSFTDD